MPEYLSPGVYVEEIDRGPKPIEGVGTAMPVFIGFTEKAQIVEQVDGETVLRDVLGLPQLVTNWSQFVERFGGLLEGAYLPHSVYGYFLNGGNRCYVVSVRTIPKAQTALLNAEGKPQLLVRAKQAGFDGMRLRVKVETPPPAEGESPADGATPFTLTVEREKKTGGWQAAETVRDVQLTEVALDDGAKRVGVAYKQNKAPQLIESAHPRCHHAAGASAAA